MTLLDYCKTQNHSLKLIINVVILKYRIIIVINCNY